jgi:hypothetical protein
MDDVDLNRKRGALQEGAGGLPLQPRGNVATMVDSFAGGATPPGAVPPSPPPKRDQK